MHGADLLADVPGQVRRLAEHLGRAADDDATATTSTAMRERTEEVAPHAGVLRDRWRPPGSGRSGDGRAAASREVHAQRPPPTRGRVVACSPSSRA